MSGSFVKGCAVGLVCALVGCATVALAGSGVGGVFNLGVTNSVNATTKLSGSVGGAAQLAVVNGSSADSTIAVQGKLSAGAPSSAAGVRGVGEGQGIGVFGSGARGVLGTTSSSQFGVEGMASGSGGTGVYGTHTAATGTGPGVRGDTDSTSAYANGVLGHVTSASPGVFSASVRGINDGTGGSGFGVWGSHSGSGTGVYGSSPSGYGVYGTSLSGTAAVYGNGGKTAGYFSTTVTNGNGVIGEATTGSSAFGVWGISSTGYAGVFSGNVQVNGNLNVTGTKNFRIDDPLDPANKYLVHAAVESDQALDTYSGNITTDSSGLAVVQLPAWFDRINADFRYQLTIVGTRGWNARISEEIKDNQFTIQTDQPNVQVSWQVTAQRIDPYMRAHPFQAEQAKTGAEQGKYIDPQAYGQPASASIEKKPPPPQPPTAPSTP